jgi:hypothetical protein
VNPVGFESREATKGLFEFFDGRIFHVVYEIRDHAASRSS